MKFEETKNYGYLVLSGWELQRWNLKFLVYKNEQVVTFCATDFYVKKIVKYDNMFIVLAVLQSAWNMKELKKQIRRRAPHLDMDDDDFFRVHKSYRKELTKIENESYYVGEAPNDFMDPEMREDVEKMKAKIQMEEIWLSNWERIKGNKTYLKHEKNRDALLTQVNRLEMIYNRPDETDMWTDCETTYDDFELYHF